MFKIARIAKQIFNASRNIQQAASVSINSMVKYCSQSKEYIEDVADEFTFLKALPSQSIKPVIQDNLKAFNPNLTNIAKVKTTQLLDSAEIRKLIYARFVNEIEAKPQKIVDTVATNDITEEFKIFKEQGYDFAATREVLQNRNQDTNQSAKSIFERMKELSISGYLSNYSGHPQLREDIEKVILRKELVIKEFMERVNERVEFISVDNESFTDVTMTDLLGEY